MRPSPLTASFMRPRALVPHSSFVFAVAALVTALTVAALGPRTVVAQEAARDPSRIERLLRPAVRISGQPDTAFLLLDRMRELHVPGVSVAIIEDLRVVYAKGFGVTEFGGTTPVDSTTLFLAGSISKPVFAMGALALVEQGRLSLDADVNASLRTWKLPPSRYSEGEKVTLRRLLAHNAGLTVWGFPGYHIDSVVPTVPQLLDGVKPANTAAVRNDTTPGARWLYSGGGITIAQLMATDVTGEDFPSLMKRLVLDPAGMSRSTYDNPLPRHRWREAATGHERPDTPVPGRFHVYPEMAAAGLWTTAADLARWGATLARAHRGDAGGPISSSMARQMVSKQVRQQQPYGTGHWGLGVAVGGADDSLTFSHGGRDEGFVAQLTVWPRQGRGIAILTNGVSGTLISEIVRAYTEVSALPAIPRRVLTVVPVAEADLAAIAGTYEFTGRGQTFRFEVQASGQGLVVRNPIEARDARLVAVGRDMFVDRDTGASWQVEREGGAITALRLGTGPGALRARRL